MWLNRYYLNIRIMDMTCSLYTAAVDTLEINARKDALNDFGRLLNNIGRLLNNTCEIVLKYSLSFYG